MSPRVFSRRKGADPIPDGAVYVGRPTMWGNPFPVEGRGREAQQAAVDRHRAWIDRPEQAPLRKDARRLLAGRDLVCWCQSPSDADPLPCHAVVLLEIANTALDV